MCEEGETYCPEVKDAKQGKSLGKICMKCKESSAALLIRAGDAFCKSCFKEYFVHKFRATLGKNRVIYPGEKVLLAYSGGPSSSAMVRQVQEGLSRDAPKKLRFVPGILFIDEGTACGMSWEERQQILSEICSVLQQTKIPFHIVSLEQVFSLPGSVLQRGAPEQRPNYKEEVDRFLVQEREQGDAGCSEMLERLEVTDSDSPGSSDKMYQSTCSHPPDMHTQKLKQLFASAKTLTAKQQLLHTLRSHLILHIARTCGYSKVMTGESCTRLSIRLLSNVSLGRGAFLPLDTGFCDSRYGDVDIIRPMREYSSKEIAYYNRFFNVSPIFIPALDTKASENSSIQHLTEVFVNRLQADFPSTVSTLYRTSEKLNVSKIDADQETCAKDRCLLCLSPLDTQAGKASAFSATQLSHHLSQKIPMKSNDLANNSDKSCCQGGQGCKEAGYGDTCQSRALQTPSFVHMLCYSCRLTVKDMQSLDVLPQYVLHEAEHRCHRTEMRKEIQEFLLDEDDGDS
ncbi:cytoplasmic tRNA 2-thiolation protein 2-A [Xenopus laevis]|uniref:Cytoplasmic tRNA 2-thiolation protein 2-A n=1 Tax=Xenopus laevis TaxID=8355 RepID=CTU2A_XENLA|nr:cytoplasmic tRNA 2-thiolation protein 2-A [Xenopus laevis]Q08B12.1 RecName: Full=Cytoplasmic tRNA 2-thiolation protein 2-A [Xenopus laevis]AAI24922.1 Unknown (protein for MGC:154644) [Xenopus laevis]